MENKKSIHWTQINFMMVEVMITKFLKLMQNKNILIKVSSLLITGNLFWSTPSNGDDYRDILGLHTTREIQRNKAVEETKRQNVYLKSLYTIEAVMDHLQKGKKAINQKCMNIKFIEKCLSMINHYQTRLLFYKNELRNFLAETQFKDYPDGVLDRLRAQTDKVLIGIEKAIDSSGIWLKKAMTRAAFESTKDRLKKIKDDGEKYSFNLGCSGSLYQMESGLYRIKGNFLVHSINRNLMGMFEQYQLLMNLREYKILHSKVCSPIGSELENQFESALLEIEDKVERINDEKNN